MDGFGNEAALPMKIVVMPSLYSRHGDGTQPEVIGDIALGTYPLCFLVSTFLLWSKFLYFTNNILLPLKNSMILHEYQATHWNKDLS